MKVFKSMIDVYAASTEKCIDFFEQISQRPQKELTVDEYLQLIYCKDILEQKNLVAKNDFLRETKIKWSPVAIKENGTVSHAVFQIILLKKKYEDFSEAVKKLPDPEIYTFIEELIQKDPQELIKRDVECFDRILNHKVGNVILAPVRMINSESLQAIEDFINMQPSWSYSPPLPAPTITDDSTIKEEIRNIKEEMGKIRDSMDILKDSFPSSVTFGNNDTEEIERRLREIEERIPSEDRLREIEEKIDGIQSFSPMSSSPAEDQDERLLNIEARIDNMLSSIREIEDRITRIEEKKEAVVENIEETEENEEDEEEEQEVEEEEEEKEKKEGKKMGLIDRISSIPMKYAVAIWIAVFLILLILLMVVKK